MEQSSHTVHIEQIGLVLAVEVHNPLTKFNPMYISCVPHGGAAQEDLPQMGRRHLSKPLRLNMLWAGGSIGLLFLWRSFGGIVPIPSLAGRFGERSGVRTNKYHVGGRGSSDLPRRHLQVW